MNSMKKIIRIIVKSASGYCPYTEAYDDKLTITEDGIQYLYKPLCLEAHQPQKWTYRTNRPEFGELWSELCRLMPSVLTTEADFICDVGETTFAVTYDDKTREGETFYSTYEEPFVSCFRIIRKMLPGGEKIPAVLWLPEDEEE